MFGGARETPALDADGRHDHSAEEAFEGLALARDGKSGELRVLLLAPYNRRRALPLSSR